jgi:hypothetical protein
MLDNFIEMVYYIYRKREERYTKMKRTMSEKDFNEFRRLAIKYNLDWELVDRGNGWVCVYIPN